MGQQCNLEENDMELEYGSGRFEIPGLRRPDVVG
jgi:hypothetical protein